MIYSPISRILSHNLRHYRAERGFTQRDLAKKAKITPRSYLSLESGKSNPTLNIVDALAKALKVTASRLISLDHIKLSGSVEDFVARFEKTFLNESIGASLRDHDGVVIFRNKLTKSLFEMPESSDGKVDLLAFLPPDARETLRSQLNSERRGIASSYVNFGPTSDLKERRFGRFYPSLIQKSNGMSAYLSAIYVTLVNEDSQQSYYKFCSALLTCLD